MVMRSKDAAYRIVFVRHGQSFWNKENRFTGWYDVGLTEQGEAEAKAAAELLTKNNFTFTKGYTSVLQRAVNTYNLIT